jgi:hypothetical protein
MRQEKTASQQPPAITVNAAYRDSGGSVYIPLTMAECSAVCAKEAKGSPGLSTKGAGNALDDTSAWPKEAKYVACYGNEGELWVYQKEGDDWNRTKEVIPENTTVHVIVWDPKRP